MTALPSCPAPRPAPAGAAGEVEVVVSGAAVLVLCHGDLGAGTLLDELVRARLGPSVAVVVVDVHGIRGLTPGCLQVLAGLVQTAGGSAVAVTVIGDDDPTLDAVRAACAGRAPAGGLRVRNTTSAGRDGRPVHRVGGRDGATGPAGASRPARVPCPVVGAVEAHPGDGRCPPRAPDEVAAAGEPDGTDDRE